MKNSYSLIIVALFCAGCHVQNKPSDLPTLYHVTITITQDGLPLGGADIVLIPDASNEKWAPGGVTDSSGVAHIQTHGKYSGAPVGKYKICVSKTETEKILNRNESDHSFPPKVYRLIEEQYTDSVKTPLEIEIVQGKNTKTFDVGKAVKVLLPSSP
jgi:hypothetical protein